MANVDTQIIMLSSRNNRICTQIGIISYNLWRKKKHRIKFFDSVKTELKT